MAGSASPTYGPVSAPVSVLPVSKERQTQMRKGFRFVIATAAVAVLAVGLLPGGASAGNGQTRSQIRNQILRIFQSDRQTQQAVTNANLGTRLRPDALMGCGH